MDGKTMELVREINKFCEEKAQTRGMDKVIMALTMLSGIGSGVLARDLDEDDYAELTSLMHKIYNDSFTRGYTGGSYN